MKKTVSIISIHSYIDVITNSSTELFVCKTDKKLAAVKVVLQKILDGYNIMNDSSYKMDVFEEPWVFSIKKYREWAKKDREIAFECEKTRDWNKSWEHEGLDNYGIIRGWFHDDEDEEDMKGMRKHAIEYGERREFYSFSDDENPFKDRLRNVVDKKGNYDWKLRDKEVEKIYKEIAKSKDKPKWWDEPWRHQYCDTLVKDMDGSVILSGSDDNSIPYDIWEFINSKLNGTNYHLG